LISSEKLSRAGDNPAGLSEHRPETLRTNEKNVKPRKKMKIDQKPKIKGNHSYISTVIKFIIKLQALHLFTCQLMYYI